MNFPREILFSSTCIFLFSFLLKAQKHPVSAEDFDRLNERAKTLMIRLDSLQKNDSQKTKLIMEDANKKSNYLPEEKSEKPSDSSSINNLGNSKVQNDKPDLEDLDKRAAALLLRLEKLALETDVYSDPEEFSLDDLLIQQSSSDDEVGKSSTIRPFSSLQGKKQDDEVPLVVPLVKENFPALTPEGENLIEPEKRERNPSRDSITQNKKIDWLDLQIRASALGNKLDAYRERPKPVTFDDSTVDRKSPKKLTKQGNGWRLEVLRELALENSPRISVKKAEFDVQAANIPILEFQYFPTLTARAGIDDYTKIAQFETYSEPEPYNVFSYGFDVKWVLYNGYKLRKQIETAKLEVAKAQRSIYLEEQSVLRELIMSYFDILNAKISNKFFPKIEAFKLKRQSIYEKQVDAGLKDRMFLISVNREIESLRIQKMQNDASIEIALSRMSSLLFVDENFWKAYENFLVPPDLQLGDIIDPDDSLLAQLGEADIEIAKSRYIEIESEHSPTVELVGSTGFRERNQLNFDSNNHEITLGISVQVPVFDHFLTKRKLRKANKEILRAEHGKVNFVNQFKNQWVSESLKYDLANQNLNFHQELLNLQKEKLNDLKSVSSKGVIDKSIPLQEEEEILQREMLMEQAKVNRLRQKYLLDLLN